MNNIKSAVIIGAGITGVLTAWRLAEEGHTVTLLEAQHLGAGSSSRTAAGIRHKASSPIFSEPLRLRTRRKLASLSAVAPRCSK